MPPDAEAPSLTTARDGIRHARWPALLAGAGGAATVGLLGAAGLAPLLAGLGAGALATGPLIEWLTSMGMNALAGWVGNLATDGMRAALADDQPDPAWLAALAQRLDAAATNNQTLATELATLLKELDAVPLALAAIAEEQGAQREVLRLQYDLLQRLSADMARLKLADEALRAVVVAQADLIIAAITAHADRSDARLDQILKEVVALRDGQQALIQISGHVGDVTFKGDVAGGDLYKGNTIYQIVQHQERLRDYLAMLQRMAAREAAATLQATPSLPQSAMLPFAALCLRMARVALNWKPSEDADDPLTRRTIVTHLLLPLASQQFLDHREMLALDTLASPEVTRLVKQIRQDYIKRLGRMSREEYGEIHMHLLTALAEPHYTAGVVRLLQHMAHSEVGQRALGVAYAERVEREAAAAQQPTSADQPPQPAPVPWLLHFFAAGIAGERVGAAVGVGVGLGVGVGAGLGLTTTLLKLLAPPAEPPLAEPPPAPAARPVASTTWRIPVTIAQWHDEVAQRNEHFGAPAGYWCYVRPGTYRIGGWERDERHANLTLPAFWIARVPIVVAQYAAFMDDGGYHERHWWTAQSWWNRRNELSSPWRWNYPPWNHRPRQALTGVTWNEAMAYCAWLSAQLRLPQGYTVRLPSEAEWEVAAAYDAAWHRHNYPWGETAPTDRHAVFERPSNEGAPDVATCAAGAAACGALDLAGTVWELASSSSKAYPEGADALAKDFTGRDDDVLFRGGAYHENSTNVRCGARLRGLPGLDLSYVRGFRVILSPRSRIGSDS
ncbi:SUMF1/EgtB/PvdO family nonheme iron enzyme [Candidatus Viridilinea mediisalina]|uniref:Sulfatase-modifying factor enzyme-like domain-containing protein n=1 Tax=Candidatus Viridilinea mediisalina TaxID=2024553 RepID=A0A2A6REC0_9CHLR|nr:SUMF1/EgtB/PvdO family nonheme iron enzyme [Candidatus Viridilinea mediisalina]PDW01180.1 hypothetical protein CJ255_19515 [Candidatus Viridilinea mediisalina]